MSAFLVEFWLAASLSDANVAEIQSLFKSLDDVATCHARDWASDNAKQSLDDVLTLRMSPSMSEPLYAEYQRLRQAMHRRPSDVARWLWGGHYANRDVLPGVPPPEAYRYMGGYLPVVLAIYNYPSFNPSGLYEQVYIQEQIVQQIGYLPQSTGLIYTVAPYDTRLAGAIALWLIERYDGWLVVRGRTESPTLAIDNLLLARANGMPIPGRVCRMDAVIEAGSQAGQPVHWYAVDAEFLSAWFGHPDYTLV